MESDAGPAVSGRIPCSLDSTVTAASEYKDAEPSAAVLGILERVRAMCAGASMLQELKIPVDVAIVELHEASGLGYHGRTSIHVDKWCDVSPGVRVAVEWRVRAVAVRLVDDDGTLLPMEMILATFLHELAHVVTRPEMRSVDAISPWQLKLQPNAQPRGSDRRELIPLHHSERFYANFALILRAAELLGIFVLPRMKDKFAPRSLTRFDNIDPGVTVGGFHCGTSPLFASALVSSCEGKASSSDGKQCAVKSQPLRLLVAQQGRNQQKPVALLERTLASLLREARKRLNSRKSFHTAVVSDGTKVDDELLASMSDDTVIIMQ